MSFAEEARDRILDPGHHYVEERGEYGSGTGGRGQGADSGTKSHTSADEIRVRVDLLLDQEDVADTGSAVGEIEDLVSLLYCIPLGGER